MPHVLHVVRTQLTVFYGRHTSIVSNNSSAFNEGPGNREAFGLLTKGGRISGRKGRDLLSCVCFYFLCIAVIFISPPFPCRFIWRILRVAFLLFIRISIRRPYVRSRVDDLFAVISVSGFIFLSYCGVFGFYCLVSQYMQCWETSRESS